MLKKAKQTFLGVARATGLFTLILGSRWRSNRLLILGYHGVSLEDEHLWHPEMYLSPENFRFRMQLLRDWGCNVLPLGEAVSSLQNGSLPEKAVVITIDDGFYDFYAAAHPILKEFGFPATVYQTTYYCFKNKPVFDLITSYLLWKGRNSKLDGEKFIGEPGVMDLSSHNKRHANARKLRSFVAAQKLSGAEKDRFAETLAQELRLDYVAILNKRILQLMTAAELKQLSSLGIDIQLHTHRHRTPSDATLFKREIIDNRNVLASLTSSAAIHFCYPSGVYKREFLPWLRELNIASATICDPGLANTTTDPLLLPRLIDTSSLSNIEFEGWITGLSSMLPSRPVVRYLG